jgi:hypothetical protein
MTQPSDWLSVVVGGNLSVPSLSGVSPIATGDGIGGLYFGSPTLFKNVQLNAQNDITISVGAYSIDIESGLNVQALGDGTTTTLASTITVGASNGQSLLDDCVWGEAQATSTSALQCAVYTTQPNTSGYVQVRISGRVTVAGGGASVNDTWVGEYTVGFKNISGSLSIVGTLTANNGSPFHDSSLAGISLSASSSVANVIIFVESISGATVLFQTKLAAFVI